MPNRDLPLTISELIKIGIACQFGLLFIVAEAGIEL
jgi:hypothetical protein